MVRQIRLREQGYDTYDAYLRSAAWRDLKARYRESDLPQICMCGCTEVQLHHTTYERVGREELDDLIPLCQSCHTQAHILERAGLVDLDLQGFYYDPGRAAQNATAEEARKAKAEAEYLSHDPVAAARLAHETKQALRKSARRPWTRSRDETPEEADARRAKSTRARLRREEPYAPHAARVDANR